MDYKNCLKRIQEYLEDSPLIVLGSGASASFGLPLMGDIRNEILSHRHIFSDKRYTPLLDNLQTMGLEEAIDKSDLPGDLNNQIREFVWNYVSRHDIQLFNKLTTNKTDFAMAELLHKVLRPTPNTATVITTNYDRVAEYAADIMGASVVTGFEGNLIRKMEFPNTKVRNTRIRARERVVQILKVHGSLDWFKNADGDIVSYPMPLEIPSGHEPLIIPPGKDKYSATHNDPFRGVMFQADEAFRQAGSFICVGYGFNDEHVQPRLIEQIHTGKPIVVLCYEATDACRRNVISDSVKKYAVIERRDGGKTSVTSSAVAGKSEEYDADFWELSNFMETVWR